MVVTRMPCPALRPYVRQLWAATSPPGIASAREHVLPTASMHLAFRLGTAPLRVFSSAGDAQGVTLGHAVVGGARGHFHIRETGGQGASAGALLAPGSAFLLLGAPADALAARHTPLADLWGHAAGDALAQLDEADGCAARLDALERILLQRLDRATAPGVNPVVACVLSRLRAGASVEAAVSATGFSHRHVLTLFRHATGLAPKQYSRVLRLQGLLRQAALPDSPCWAQLALQAGFSDQSHLHREFLAFAGMTPASWRRAGGRHPNHVPVAAA